MGINKFTSNNNLIVYPKPAQNKITIGAMDIVEVKLFYVVGNQITATNQNQIDVSNFTNGVYLIQVLTKKGSAKQKIIVQH